jgi:hypothetical protein
MQNTTQVFLLDKNSRFAIYFIWRMTSGKLATLSWQIGPSFLVTPQQNLPENFWQIGIFWIGVKLMEVLHPNVVHGPHLRRETCT